MNKAKEYAFSTVLDSSYEDTISSVTDALKNEGFGILTQIDVKATLKKKLSLGMNERINHYLFLSLIRQVQPWLNHKMPLPNQARLLQLFHIGHFHQKLKR